MDYNVSQFQHSNDESNLSLVGIGNSSYQGDTSARSQEQYDVFASFRWPTMLTSEEFPFEFDMEGMDVPEIQLQAPSRMNTNLGEMDGPTASDQSWSALWVGFGERHRAAVDTDVPSSTSLPRNVPIRASSVTSLIDSGFSSPDICEVCQHVYKSRSSKKKHALTHIKPYKCQYSQCTRSEKGFATANDLDRHHTSIHKNGLKIWFRCAYPGCQKTDLDHYFCRQDNFKAHIERRHRDLTSASEIDALIVRSRAMPTHAELDHALPSKAGRVLAAKASFSRKAPLIKRMANAYVLSRGAAVCSHMSALSCELSKSAPAAFPATPLSPMQGVSKAFASASRNVSDGEHSGHTTREQAVYRSLSYPEPGDHELRHWSSDPSDTFYPTVKHFPQQQSMTGLAFASEDTAPTDGPTTTYYNPHTEEPRRAESSYHPVCPVTGYSPLMQDQRQSREFDGPQIYSPIGVTGAATTSLSSNQAQGQIFPQSFSGQWDGDQRSFYDTVLRTRES